jgi:protein-S-isoprenylcysteine O-methyltransferase Ste14
MNKKTFADIRARIFIVVMMALPFLSAGRLDLWRIWVWMGIFLTSGIVCRCVIDRGLYYERLCPDGPDKDRFTRWTFLPIWIAQLVIVGLDLGRFHFSDTIPTSVSVVGAVVMAAGFAFNAWAMAVNKFFSRAIRIQQDRGQHLVTTGPYRYVRHPGYTGMIFAFFGGGLLLGSLWALVPVFGLAVVIVKRMILEDRLLQRELAGYIDYMQKVRFRLVPWIW